MPFATPDDIPVEARDTFQFVMKHIETPSPAIIITGTQAQELGAHVRAAVIHLYRMGGFKVHVVNQTAAASAISAAGDKEAWASRSLSGDAAIRVADLFILEGLTNVEDIAAILDAVVTLHQSGTFAHVWMIWESSVADDHPWIHHCVFEEITNTVAHIKWEPSRRVSLPPREGLHPHVPRNILSSRLRRTPLLAPLT